MATFLSMAPILCLLFCLLLIKMSTRKASALSFLTAAVIFFAQEGPGVVGFSLTMAKGFSLALFVVLIIWAAMFLYHLVAEAGALEVIHKNLEILVRDRFIQFILLSWIFSAFLQGIAGFGVPVIVVTPILIALGFDRVTSAAAVLVGHSWAISFGSMGSSIYAISMVTEAPVGGTIVYMAIFGVVAMFGTGLSVCGIYDGFSGLLRGFPCILILSVVMGAQLILLAFWEMVSVIGLLTGLTGLVACFLLGRLRQRTGERLRFFKAALNLPQAVLPYLLIVILSLLFYLLDPALSIGFDFAGYQTAGGRVVPSEEGYVTFNILKFPFTIILISSLICMPVYQRKGTLDRPMVKSVLIQTMRKCTPTSVTIVFLLSMAVIMMDSGMIEQIARSLVAVTGSLYPLVAPFIGLLGAFVTGSNTNSNIIFGSLQETAALSLGMNAVIMCAVQSIGASIGGSIGPTTVSLAATAAHIQGEESRIYRKNLIPILLIAGLLGSLNVLLLR